MVEVAADGPVTIDPAACWDTVSGELLMNMYDTLVVFDGEHLDKYLPQLADTWAVQNIAGVTSPDGLPSRAQRQRFLTYKSSICLFTCIY
jgi:hypothetical protein